LVTPDKKEKAVVVFLNVVIAIVWVRFLVRLITRWNFMGPDVRDLVSLFMLFFSMWWLTAIREPRRYFSLLMAGGVFMTVYAIVKSLM
jgi:hypothetical protein